MPFGHGLTEEYVSLLLCSCLVFAPFVKISNMREAECFITNKSEQ